MKIFVRASIAAAALASAPTQAAFPAEVTALMDTTADPCEDFYQYTCGNWVKNFALAADVGWYTYSFNGINTRNAAAIRSIAKENKPLIGEFWDSCMGMDALTAQGNKPLQRDLARIAAVTNKTDMAKMAGELGSIGPSLFTGTSVAPDSSRTETNALYIGSAGFVLPDPSYYLDSSAFARIEEPFRKFISTIITLSGINLNGESKDGQQKVAGCVDLKHVEDIVIKFETKLAEILPTDDELDQYYSLTYSEAATKYPLTFQAMTEGFHLLDKSSLTKDSKVLFNSLPFMDRAEQLFNSADVQELKIYYSFLYASTYSELLGKDFLQARFDFFDAALNGFEASEPRELVCTNSLINQLPELIGDYYFLEKFDEDHEENVRVMVNAIEQAMGDHLGKLAWIDDATRGAAYAKLSKVANLIAARHRREATRSC